MEMFDDLTLEQLEILDRMLWHAWHVTSSVWGDQHEPNHQNPLVMDIGDIGHDVTMTYYLRAAQSQAV